YPLYFLALLVAPRVPSRTQRALVALDASLLVGAAFALSWYFLLAPIYADSHVTPLGKLVSLSYPLGDLAIFCALTLIWLRYREYEVDRAVVVLLLAAIASLVVADTWLASLMLEAVSYQSGSPSDLFWMVFYLLVPLLGLVQFRLTQRKLAG